MYIIYLQACFIISELTHREMRGAAWSGLVVLLFTVPVIQSQNGWGVTYTSTQICALKGSTVEIRCSYRYPSTIVGGVKETFWFTKESNNVYVDLTTDPEYSGRVQYHSENKDCTLRISDLRERDSAEYKFRFATNQDGKYTGYPGVTLSVTGLQVQISGFYTSSNKADLKCQSSCPLPGHPSYIWYKNGQDIQGQTSDSYSASLDPADSFSCAVRGHENSRSPSVYPQLQVHVRRSTVRSHQQPTWTELTCHNKCQLPDHYSYIWYKNGQKFGDKKVYFHLDLFNPADNYSCAVSGYEMFPSPSVYAPKRPSVSVSPSGDLMEGSSVNVTCNSDANPAANYSWYKNNLVSERLSEGPQLIFSSIQSSDSGQYYCTAENKLGRTSANISINVKYAPKLPSVSMVQRIPLCHSDANPAARYTWYKENEDSPKASGQIFTITDFRAEHSGNYYCEAQNRRGRQNSTLHLTVVADKSTITLITNSIRLTLVGVGGLIPLLLFCRRMRKKKALSSTTEPNEPIETVETLVLSMRKSQRLQHKQKTQRSRKTWCEAKPEGDSHGGKQKEVFNSKRFHSQFFRSSR
ncbi:B-cell receptor CD22-like [Perca fluviatilis]|uniref:B-cell receptor CD22-like n=1 Tax=Perca fluviatilis TaxID=8168 RepID=UPI001964F196|nr:B-cell receptor CD22-like [Perca fluviatilis]